MCSLTTQSLAQGRPVLLSHIGDMSRQRRHHHDFEDCDTGGLGHTDYSKDYQRRCQRDQSSQSPEPAEPSAQEHATSVGVAEPAKTNRSAQHGAQMQSDSLAGRNCTSQGILHTSFYPTTCSEPRRDSFSQDDVAESTKSTDAPGMHSRPCLSAYCREACSCFSATPPDHPLALQMMATWTMSWTLLPQTPSVIT